MSHETRTSPPTYPELLDIHDGAFSESIWGSDGFKTIKVSGQDDVIADSYKDNLTIAAGANVTLTTNAAGDTLTIAAAGSTYTAGTGLQLSGNQFSVTSLAVTNVHEAANQTAQLALTTQEGDVVVRTDENKSYVKNSGTAGSMSDWTLLRTPTDVVLSVAGNTGAVTANQIAAAVEAATDSNTFTDADHSKLNAIEPNATADQTNEEIQDIVGGMLTGNTETGITVTYEDGDGTIDFVVASQTANDFTNTLKSKLDGIENSATADQTDAEIRAAVEAATDSNVFTDTDHSKLNAIESLADVTDTANVTSAGAVMKTTVDALGDLLVASADNTVTRLARGTDGYILKSNSSTGTGLEWTTAGSGGDVNQNAFTTVAVSGQDNVVADTTTDTLNLAAGNNVTLTTNATSDTVTIAASNTDATKMPLAGGSFTGNVKFNDAKELQLGNSANMKIYHDSTNFITNSQNLDIRAKDTNGGLVTISDSAGTNLIKATAGSKVELTYNGNSKLETESGGVKVTGTLTATLANNSIANAQVADDAIGVAELSATGTASSSTYLRGDNTWATVSSGGAALTGSTNNTVCTVTGANAFQGEANLTFDGTSLGIGTASPGDTLHINHASDPAIRFHYGSNSGYSVIKVDSVNQLELDVDPTGGATSRHCLIKVGGSEKFRFNGNTSIGIGGANYGTSGQVLTSGGSTGAVSWTTISSGGLSNIVEDTSPQLGGDLDTNSFEISLDNDHKVKFGATAELTIHSDGTNGVIRQTNNQPLYIQGDNFIQIGKANQATPIYAKFIKGGAVDLYYDGNKKLATTLTGATVTGTLVCDSSAVGTAGLRKVHASTSAPGGGDGADGDLWIKY